MDRIIAVVALVAITAAIASCGSTAATRRRVALTAPGCSMAVTRGPRLTGVRTRFVSLRGSPFGVVTTADGRWSFVGLADGQIDVMSDASFAPTLVRTITVPGQRGATRGASPDSIATLGLSLTHDGRYLLAADDETGAVVIDAARAEQGLPNPVLGVLSAGTGSSSRSGTGAIEVTASPSGDYAFVTLEYDGGGIAVYNLRRALATSFRDSGFVGTVPLGLAPVGIAVSPNGKLIYATSELARSALATLARRRAAGQEGTLSVVDLRRAETSPRSSVLATVPAGCGAVRVVVSANGGVVWVTARESDALLAFSADALRRDPGRALLADVRVGEAPVGLALIDGGRRVAVTDSNRFGATGASSGVTLVSTAAARAHRAAVIGSVAAGGFPREMALEPDGATLLVTNFASSQLEAIAINRGG
jgi:DNA-binding beta-propeller fold protein YncE